MKILAGLLLLGFFLTTVFAAQSPTGQIVFKLGVTQQEYSDAVARENFADAVQLIRENYFYSTQDLSDEEIFRVLRKAGWDGTGDLPANLFWGVDSENNPSQDDVRTTVSVKGACPAGQRIADQALKFVNKLKYVWGGVSLSKGADCSGFVQSVLIKS